MVNEDFFRQLFGGQHVNVFSSGCGISHGKVGCCAGLVYVARGDNGTVKIGSTNGFDALPARMTANRHQYGMGFTLLFALRTHCRRGLERKIHNRLASCRVTEAKGRELFRPDDQLLLWVSRINKFADQPVVLIPAIELL